MSKFSIPTANQRKLMGYRSPSSDSLDSDFRTSSDYVLKVFNAIKDEDEKVSLFKLINLLKNQGLQIESDNRLKSVQKLIETSKKETCFIGTKLEVSSFTSLLNQDHDLIIRALTNNLAIVNFPAFLQFIELLYDEAKNNTQGAVASYIPELQKVDPELWGFSICTVDGQRRSIGDAAYPFTFQSISKAFAYGWALELMGQSEVHKYVGHEPTNEDFNAIIVDSKNRPHNPMVNAGAIVICGLIQSLARPQATDSERFDECLAFFKGLAGNEFVGFNNMVFISERDTAARNRAITYFMKAKNSFPPTCDHLKALEFYLQTCSLETTCDSLSVMGATLANSGVCPLTGKRVLSKDTVKCVLSLMQSCGMYNYSGEFAHMVGLPAKSGVSGGICVVIPGLMGIATYSPRLNDFGCSCRGLEICMGLVKSFTFHPYDNLPCWPRSTILKGSERQLMACAPITLAEEGDSYSLSLLVAGGFNMSCTNFMGRTPLHAAAARGHIKTVTFLVKNCPSLLNKVDLTGNTALDDARFFHHADVVELLERSMSVTEGATGIEHLTQGKTENYLNTEPIFPLKSTENETLKMINLAIPEQR